MKQKNINLKKLLLFLLAALLTVVFSNFKEVDAGVSRSYVSGGELKIHFIDVGQADCILLEQGDSSMIIDGGTNDAEKTINNYLNNQGIYKFDYVVGTHAHEDHIGSLDYIINSFQIGKVYFPKQITTTRTFQNFMNACNKKNLKLNAPYQGETFMLGKAQCKVLSVGKEKYKDINDSSIVIKVTFGNTSFLLTGDAGKVAEEEMLNSGVDLKADVLKVGHHGSKTATTDKFLKAVNPRYSVISVGKNNKYNLPSQETMSKLRNNNIPVYRTDERGTIVATSDGNRIIFN